MRYFSLIVFAVTTIFDGCVYADSAYWHTHALSAKQKRQLARKEEIDVTTSLIIPCYYKHAENLYPLLRMYEQQSRLPDEVVISLSEAHRVAPELLAQLRSELWAFPITLLLTEKKQLAGPNRNTACSYAKGDIVICQDADDIVHPQRIEVIHYFFSHYKIDHLMHQFVMLFPDDRESPFKKYANLAQIPCIWENSFKKTVRAGSLTNGNIAIARHVFDKIKWTDKPRGQDTEFNKNVYHKFNRCIAIQAVLYGYRQFLSSAGQAGKGSDDCVVQPMHDQVWPKKYALRVVNG